MKAEEFIKQNTPSSGEWNMEALTNLLIRFAKFHCVEQKNAILVNCEHIKPSLRIQAGYYIMDTEIEKIKYYKNIV